MFQPNYVTTWSISKHLVSILYFAINLQKHWIPFLVANQTIKANTQKFWPHETQLKIFFTVFVIQNKTNSLLLATKLLSSRHNKSQQKSYWEKVVVTLKLQ